MADYVVSNYALERPVKGLAVGAAGARKILAPAALGSGSGRPLNAGVRPQRQPMTPSNIVEVLSQVVPGFGDHWSTGESLFIGEDGEFASAGVFAECSHFVRENFSALPATSLSELGEFLSNCMEERFGDDIANAAASCFLENLAGEPFHQEFAVHLRPVARKFYDGVVGV